MKVNIQKLTNESIYKDILKFTTNKDDIQLRLSQLYSCEHSPIYTQMFVIYLEQIPSFVSVHLTRHEKNGCQHFVSSARGDRTGIADEEINRMTPVNHVIFCNAKHLIDMSRKRLCNKAHRLTQKVFLQIKEKMKAVDKDLSAHMLPDCSYRGGVCHELKKCGRI